MPLDFENNLAIDGSVASRAYVSAIAQNDLKTKVQKVPKKLLIIEDPLNFQIQVANVKLEKTLARATLKFEIGDKIVAEHFVVMKNLFRPIVELHFLRNNSVVIDTTQGLFYFPPLMMQVKTVSNETTAKPQPVNIDDALTVPPRTSRKSQILLTILQTGTQQGLSHHWRSKRKQQVC